MENQTFLTFVIEKEYFAVPVTKVLEVLERQSITKVPQTPPHILGIINFRGDILPVIDSRLKFNLPPQDEVDKHFIIVYDLSSEQNRLLIAATSDTVKDVIHIDVSEVKPVPELGISYDSRYINGVVRRNEEFILLLDIEKVFNLGDFEIPDATELLEMKEAGV